MKYSTLSICFFFLLSNVSRAQSCSGSLGDPVLNEDFGTKNYSLPPYKTQYKLVGGCPDEMGTYTLSGFLFGCGPHSWVQMVGDHTRNQDGNYMLVNAASTAGVVYTDTAKNLCSNTTYQFGIWVTSVMTKYACDGNAVLPNLIFTIKTLSGTVLGRDSTGNLPIVDDREWKFYNFSAQTPAGVTAVIVSVTINPKYGCGSAFAIDDITLKPCSPSTISATIDGGTGPVEVCADYGGTWNLAAAYTPGFLDPEFQWQESNDTGKTWVDIPGEKTLSYQVPHRSSGTVLYRVCIAERGNINSVSCRVTSNIIRTGVHPLPEHIPPRNVIGCIGQDFHFPSASPFSMQALWTGPNGFGSTDPVAIIPAVQPKDTGLYKLKETYDFGCILLDTFYLKVFPGAVISVQPSYPICEGTSEPLHASASDTVSYLWKPANGLSGTTIPDPVASPREYTEYWVYVTNKYGCTDSAELVVDVYKKPFADAGPDKKINLGDSVVLNGAVNDPSVNYLWTPSSFINDVHTLTPTVYPQEDGIYTLTASSTQGCGSVSSSATVKVFRDVYIPNSFTPNDDGRNDLFRVIAADNYRQFELLIYNRWGGLIFKTNDINRGWNGKFNSNPQPSDVYIYYLKMRTASNKVITKKGMITLLR